MHNLDQRHDGNGIEEVHPDNLGRAAGEGSEFGDGDGGGVGGEECRRGQDAIEGTEYTGFQFEAFRRGFDGQQCSGERFHVHGWRDAVQGRFDVALGEFALGGLAAQVGPDGSEGAIEGALVDVAQLYLKARSSEDVRYAGAHGSRADYGN